jgi:hypothetical protein
MVSNFASAAALEQTIGQSTNVTIPALYEAISGSTGLDQIATEFLGG